jgi:hypothetical protein
MLLGTPCSCIIPLKNKFTMLIALFFLLHVMKYIILENLSIATKIESLPIFYLGKPKT